MINNNAVNKGKQTYSKVLSSTMQNSAGSAHLWSMNYWELLSQFILLCTFVQQLWGVLAALLLLLEETQMEPVVVTALPVQGWDPFLLLLYSTTNQTSRWRGGFTPQKYGFVFWIKYTRYHAHCKVKGMFQKLSSCESTFPVLSAHNPNKTKRTGKGMPLVGHERKNK